MNKHVKGLYNEKKIIEILSEVTICQSQHFLKNLSFYSSGEAEKMLVARTFE